METLSSLSWWSLPIAKVKGTMMFTHVASIRVGSVFGTTERKLINDRIPLSLFLILCTSINLTQVAL